MRLRADQVGGAVLTGFFGDGSAEDAAMRHDEIPPHFVPEIDPHSQRLDVAGGC